MSSQGTDPPAAIVDPPPLVINIDALVKFIFQMDN